MDNNIIQMLLKAKNSSNPQQFVLNLMQQKLGSTPFEKNLISLAKTGNDQGIEQIARNMCAAQGKDFDQEFNEFKNNFGF